MGRSVRSMCATLTITWSRLPSKCRSKAAAPAHGGLAFGDDSLPLRGRVKRFNKTAFRLLFGASRGAQVQYAGCCGVVASTRAGCSRFLLESEHCHSTIATSDSPVAIVAYERLEWLF